MRISGRQYFKALGSIIDFCAMGTKILPRFVRWRLFLMFRHTEGNLGMLARYVLFKTLTRQCGSNVAIYPGAYLFELDGWVVGDNVSIHEMCCVRGRQVTIGSNVAMAHGCSILAVSHQYDDPVVPIKYQKIVNKPVTIGSNVWLGAKVTVLYGTTIGDGSVIGAGSVVTKDIPENVVAVGTPARVIKKRIPDEVIVSGV